MPAALLVLLEPPPSFVNQSAGHFDLFPAFDFGPLAFEFLVNGEEMFNFTQNVRCEIGMIFYFGVCRACFGNGEDFFIRNALVDHFQDADRTGFDKTARERRVGDENNYVERVSVRAQGAGNETVFARVMNRSVKRAVQAKELQVFVILVFVRAAARNFHDGIHDFGRTGAGRQP